MNITLKPGWARQTIAATGQSCSPGETIDVDDELGRSLCQQVDKWAAVKPKKTAEGTATKPDEGDTKENP